VIIAKVQEEKNELFTDNITSVIGTISEGENTILSAMGLKENGLSL